MVKACGYCGRTNADEARFCQECGTDFDHPRAKALPAVEDALVDSAPATDLSDLDMGFRMVEAFSRPDWNLIHEYINKQAVPEWDLKKAWTYVAERWLERLAKDLGGTYGIHRSRSFLCLSDLEREDRESLLIFAERTLSIIRNLLGPAAWTGYEGSHVLLIFSEEDDYYSY